MCYCLVICGDFNCPADADRVDTLLMDLLTSRSLTHQVNQPMHQNGNILELPVHLIPTSCQQWTWLTSVFLTTVFCSSTSTYVVHSRNCSDSLSEIFVQLIHTTLRPIFVFVNPANEPTPVFGDWNARRPGTTEDMNLQATWQVQQPMAVWCSLL